MTLIAISRFRFALVLAGALAAVAPAQGRADLAGAYLAARSADLAGDYTASRDYLTRALAADPSNTGLLEGLVMAHLGAGDVKAAVPVARRLVSLGSTAQVARIVMLADMLQREDYAQVLKDLEEGDARLVGPLVDQLVRAWAHLGTGSMAQAQDGFAALANTPGLEAFGLYHQALALAMVGDFEGADRLFADEGNGLATLRRAVFAHAQVLSQLDRSAEALTELDALFGPVSDPELDALRAGLRSGEPLAFDTVTSVRDGMAEVFHLLSVVLQGEAPDSQTLIHTRIAEYLRPDHVDAILLTASVLDSQGQGELAVAAYDRIPADDPAFLAAASGKAQTLYRIGRKDEAIEAMSALVESHGQYLSVHVGLGDLLRREERHADAAAAYTRGIDLVGEPVERHWGLFYSRGIAWERAKQWEKAEPDFRKALALNPDQPQVLNYLGYSLLDMNRNIDEALTMIKKAVEQRPDDGYIVDSLAWGLFLTGRFDEAVGHMERASLLMPVDPIVTDHLGDVYWAVGRTREAEFQWRRALSFNPEEKDALRIRRKLEIGLDAVLAEEGMPPLSERRQK
jgi:tetratricopeptide (TPR) repeat protein